MTTQLAEGLKNQILTSGTYAEVCPSFMVTDVDPNTFFGGSGLITFTGSDIAYNISNGVFYIGNIPGGSVWSALKTI